MFLCDVKILFIAISTMLIINILIFISPLVIPLILLSSNKKARGIFDNWLKNLLGYSMVMIVVLVVLAIFFKVIDFNLYGNKLGDLYIYDSAKNELVINPECKMHYPLCLVENTKRTAGTAEGIFAYEPALAFFSFAIKFFTIFLIMLLILSLVMQTLIPNILSVSLMNVWKKNL